jgi:thiol-disulfide isomerase/thioredoxin
MAERPAPSTRTRWVGAAVAMAVAVAVVLAVVLLDRGGPAGGDVTVAAGTPTAGRVPPQFSGTAVDGQHFALSAERGRVVLVNFFATWCGNCRAELPLLQRTYAQQHGRGLDVVTVDFNDGGDARAFLAPFALSFPALLDPSSRVGHAYLVTDLPVSFFVGRDGRVAGVFHGQLSQDTLSAALAGLL